MKRIIVLVSLLALGGCASTQMQKAAPRPMVHVVPAPMPAVIPAPAAQPTVTVVPAAPVQPDTFEMRWKKRAGKLRNVPLFHHKKPAQPAQ